MKPWKGIFLVLTDPNDLVREDAIRCIRNLADPGSIDPLLRAMEEEPDDYLKVELADVTLELGDSRSIPTLIRIMDDGEVSQVRQDAFEHLTAHIEANLSFQAGPGPDENEEQVRPFWDYWERNRSRLQWQPGIAVFRVCE